ncbi:hypothetical protein BH10ACI1_BH10ACI1_08090 [soil metagenome]
MYFLLGFALIFSLLLAINVFWSIAAEIVWRAASPVFKNISARSRAQIIFALSVLPFAAALVFVVAFLLPAYLLFEPQKSDEVISFKLALLTFVSLTGIGFALFRVFKTRQTTRRLLLDWLRNAERIEIENISIPVYSIKHQFPVVAVVGTFRPRMFIARQILESLDAEEFRAVIAHEYGHLVNHDNLKRTVLRVCRDLLVFPLGKTLERAWSEDAESAADEFAARKGGNPAAVNLASALVKIARIAPQNASPAMPSGTFLIGENNAHITRRVQQLLHLAGSLNSHRKIPFLNPAFFSKLGFTLLFIAVFLLVINYDFLFQVHRMLETFVALIQ